MNYCKIKTSSVLPRKSSAIFGKLRTFSEKARKCLPGLWTTFGESSEIIGKCLEIFGKSSKKPLLLVVMDFLIVFNLVSLNIKLNTQREIPHLRAPMNCPLYIPIYNVEKDLASTKVTAEAMKNTHFGKEAMNLTLTTSTFCFLNMVYDHQQTLHNNQINAHALIDHSAVVLLSQ